MANSDNVVRAAFTRKHVDIDEFLAVARFDEIDPPIMQPVQESANVFGYPANTPRFGAQRIDVTESHLLTATHEAEIVVCTSGDAGAVKRGHAVVLRKGDEIRLTGNATVFRTWGNR
jgi:mannose-6-phosphate isomerase